MADARGVTHFAEGLGFNLTDAFAGDAELLADFFQRARITVAQAETEFENFALTLGQAGKDIAEFVESIPYTETREYVQAILRNREIYRALYGPQ